MKLIQITDKAFQLDTYCSDIPKILSHYTEPSDVKTICIATIIPKFEVKRVIPIAFGLSNVNSILELFKSIILPLESDMMWHVCGSRAFGVNDDMSDVDLLCIGKTTNRDTFFTTLQTFCESCGLFESVKTIKNDHYISLKMKAIVGSNPVIQKRKPLNEFISIDIQYVKSGDMTELYDINAMSLLTESQVIVDLMTKCDKSRLFVRCLTWLREQLQTYGMYGQKFGFLSGMSLAILTAYVLNKPNIVVFDSFADELRQFNFESPITLTGHVNKNPRNPVDSMLYIGTSTVPYKNTVRGLTKSTTYLTKMFFKYCRNYHVYAPEKTGQSLTFKIESPHYQSFNDSIDWFNGIICNILSVLEKNCGRINLIPDNKIKISFNEYNTYVGIWTVYYNQFNSAIENIADQIVEKAKKIFDDAYITYDVNKFACSDIADVGENDEDLGDNYEDYM